MESYLNSGMKVIEGAKQNISISITKLWYLYFFYAWLCISNGILQPYLD